jgi:hypothetical protein
MAEDTSLCRRVEMKDMQEVSIIIVAKIDLNGYDYHNDDTAEEIKTQIEKYYEEPKNIDISVMGASANLVNMQVKEIEEY